MTIVDMEAGLEHLSRGTGRHVDTLLVVMEPYYKSLETARRCAELGRELDIGQIFGVANKLRGDGDTETVRRYAETHGLHLVAEIPFDDAVYQAEAGRAGARHRYEDARRAGHRFTGDLTQLLGGFVMRVRSFLAQPGWSVHSLRSRLAAAGATIAARATRVVFLLVVGIGSVLAWGTPAFA
ncbi:MAG: hypothetical protein WKF75_12170 [Singulisphaera sp.]